APSSQSSAPGGARRIGADRLLVKTQRTDHLSTTAWGVRTGVGGAAGPPRRRRRSSAGPSPHGRRHRGPDLRVLPDRRAPTSCPLSSFASLCVASRALLLPSRGSLHEGAKEIGLGNDPDKAAAVDHRERSYLVIEHQ